MIHAENEGRTQKPFNMHTMHYSTWLHPSSQWSNQIVPQELGIKCRLSKGEPTHCYKYVVQFRCRTPTLNCDWSIKYFRENQNIRFMFNGFLFFRKSCLVMR